MARFFSRAAMAGAAFQQAKKFLDSPRGRQLTAQVKAKANDPQTRAKVGHLVDRAVTQVKSRIATR